MTKQRQTTKIIWIGAILQCLYRQILPIFRISGAAAIKQFAVPVKRKGASFADPNRSS
jgi:hypothetical protein